MGYVTEPLTVRFLFRHMMFIRSSSKLRADTCGVQYTEQVCFAQYANNKFSQLAKVLILTQTTLTLDLQHENSLLGKC